jgi:hypothetical protein
MSRNGIAIAALNRRAGMGYANRAGWRTKWGLQVIENWNDKGDSTMTSST